MTATPAQSDEFVPSWVDTCLQGLLTVPFVLNSQPAVEYDGSSGQSLDVMARSAQQRYAEIFRDVEDLILDHSQCYHRLDD